MREHGTRASAEKAKRDRVSGSLDFAVGDVIAGRYRLLRLLGEGGMGRVYLAEQNELGGHVAIKILRADVELPGSSIERLRREAQAASRLKSESVVRVLDLGWAAHGTPYFVMERVAGKTVARHLEEHGPFDLARAADIVIDVCAALAEAHALGIIHRDIKASNLALTKRPDGTELVKVLDFGIAKQTAPSVTSLTETAALLGSPKYMSPDHIRDARSVGPRDDLWSVTVLLQEMTTGGLPFEAFTLPGLFAKIIADPPTPARSLRPELPEAFEALLTKALSKDPAQRFADAAELAEALAPFASPEGAVRAGRVRAVFEHAVTPALSDPPAAASPTAIDLDRTSAPIAREHTTEGGARASSSPAGLARVLALGPYALGVLLVLVLGVLWRTRSVAPAGAAPPALAATVTMSSPAQTSPPASHAAAEPAPPPPLPIPPPLPSAASTASAKTAKPAAKPAEPRAGRRPSAVDDEDFGPRQ